MNRTNEDISLTYQTKYLLLRVLSIYFFRSGPYALVVIVIVVCGELLKERASQNKRKQKLRKKIITPNYNLCAGVKNQVIIRIAPLSMSFCVERVINMQYERECQ